MYSESSQGGPSAAGTRLDMESVSILRAAIPPGLGGPLPRLRARPMSALPAHTTPPHAQVFGRVAATSAVMAAVFSVLRRLARTDVTLTLVGETGTGKDVTAHAVHEASARAAAPFVVFDCGAVPANLVESELFG